MQKQSNREITFDTIKNYYFVPNRSTDRQTRHRLQVKVLKYHVLRRIL